MYVLPPQPRLSRTATDTAVPLYLFDHAGAPVLEKGHTLHLRFLHTLAHGRKLGCDTIVPTGAVIGVIETYGVSGHGVHAKEMD